ncbi:hypothetical protein HK102_013008, partial [Quaeritorhiza haematococci]
SFEPTAGFVPDCVGVDCGWGGAGVVYMGVNCIEAGITDCCDVTPAAAAAAAAATAAEICAGLAATVRNFVAVGAVGVAVVGAVVSVDNVGAAGGAAGGGIGRIGRPGTAGLYLDFGAREGGFTGYEALQSPPLMNQTDPFNAYGSRFGGLTTPPLGHNEPFFSNVNGANNGYNPFRNNSQITPPSPAANLENPFLDIMQIKTEDNRSTTEETKSPKLSHSRRGSGNMVTMATPGGLASPLEPTTTTPMVTSPTSPISATRRMSDSESLPMELILKVESAVDNKINFREFFDRMRRAMDEYNGIRSSSGKKGGANNSADPKRKLKKKQRHSRSLSSIAAKASAPYALTAPLREDEIPPPPQGVDASNSVYLAIHYHEHDDLRLSMHYLRQAAAKSSPIGLYMLGMALRHGWGCAVDRREAFRTLMRAAECCILSLRPSSTEAAAPSPLMDRPAPPQRSLSLTQTNTPPPTAAFDRILASYKHQAYHSLPRPTNTNNTTTHSTSGSFLPTVIVEPCISTITLGGGGSGGEPAIALSLLPLPIYELGVCFRHGWGIRRSKSEAVYCFEAAALLGDVESQYELGMCYLNGVGVKVDRMVAAKWLREADKAGKKVVGESWIRKKKWGGPEE